MLRKSEIRRVPTSYKEAVEDIHAEHYISAMMDEFSSIQDQQVCKLVPRPPNAKVVPTFWIFSLKPVGDNGELVRPKARIVANGLRQDHTAESADSYAPVLRTGVIKLILTLGLNLDIPTWHIDVKTAFLFSNLNEKVYIAQFPGFVDPKRPNDVFECIKALYGLRQSAKCFYDFLIELLAGFGLHPTLTESCLFKPANRLTPLVGSHVDDLAVLAYEQEYRDLVAYLKSKIEITEKGSLAQFIGLTVKRTADMIEINQSKYIDEMLERYGLSDCNPCRAPFEANLNLCPDNSEEKLIEISEFQQMLGSAMYVTNHTRFDGSYLTSALCRYMTSPTANHLKAIKHFMRYLKGTRDLALIYRKSDQPMVVYGDASFGGDLQCSKSVSGVLILVHGNVIDWVSRRQSYVAMSTCESEVLAIRESAVLALFYRDLMSDLHLVSLINDPTLIYNDNQSAVFSLKDGGSFVRNAHYRQKVNFIRDLVRRKFITVKHKPGKEMYADILTKAVSLKQLNEVLMQVGLAKP